MEPNEITPITRKLRFVVPFSFGEDTREMGDLGRLIADFDGASDALGTWREATVSQDDQDMYEYILESMDLSGLPNGTNIGSAFSYYPKEDTHVLQLEYWNSVKGAAEEKRFDFYLDAVGLFLFSTGVGFLWYSVDTKAKVSLDEIALFMQHFKELNLRKNTYRIRKDGDSAFLMGDWICDRLALLGAPCEFYPGKVSEKLHSGYKSVPDKALLFNYIAFDEKELDVNTSAGVQAAYYLSKGYRSSYLPEENAEKKMYRPFHNALCCVSKEGAGYYVSVSSNPGEPDRIYLTKDKGMMRKVINDYFFIFILVLHQSYTVLNFSKAIGKRLPADASAYLSPSSGSEHSFMNLEENVRQLTTEVNVFLTKNVRASVSHSQHQNVFYQYAKDKLSVQSDIQDLVFGLESLQNLMHDTRQQWEAEQEEKRDRKINSSLMILSIIAFVSAIYDGECLIREFFIEAQGPGQGPSIFSLSAYTIFFVLAVLVFVGVIIAVMKNLHGHKKKNKKQTKNAENKEVLRLQKENEALKVEARVDQLTGLYNRNGRAFFEHKMLEDAKKQKRNICVCSIDLNGLKFINDTCGHEKGDVAIGTIGRILREILPENVKAFRIGGDEFQLIGTIERDHRAPIEITDELTKRLKEYNQTAGNEFSVGASYGWEVGIPTNAMQNVNELFKVADQRMYDMKVKEDEHRRS